MECCSLALIPVVAIGALRFLSGRKIPVIWHLLFLSPPLTAGVLLGLVLFFFRGLAPRPRMAWPLTITIPTIYVALLGFTVMVWTSTGNSVVRPPEAFDALRQWSQPSTMAFLWLAQVGILSISAGLNRARQER